MLRLLEYWLGLGTMQTFKGPDAGLRVMHRSHYPCTPIKYPGRSIEEAIEGQVGAIAWLLVWSYF